MKLKYEKGKGINEVENTLICAEKELNIDVPILPNWTETEIYKIACEKFPTSIYNNDFATQKSKQIGFVTGYKHNKAQYTKEQMYELVDILKESAKNDRYLNVMEVKARRYIESLEREPKYIVIESDLIQTIKKDIGKYNHPERYHWKPKLITNSEGKQEVIIKELIF